MIELKNIYKIYRTNEIITTAIKEVSLIIEKGEFVSIMGPSGSGKSSLLNIIGLLDYADKGEYKLFNQYIYEIKKNNIENIRKNNISFIFQQFNLINELNTYQNIELPLNYFNLKKYEKKKRTLVLLEELGLADFKNKYPYQLSGGQQQRIAVARALITNPQILLADEPTGNLDSKNGEKVINLLKNIQQEGTTVIMTTHNLAFAKQSSRIINLFDGEIVSDDFFNKVYLNNNIRLFK
ncbi:MAG: ABC transporter ATP-binding protein [Candidatus Cloacimonetes bacterium]|nr:ABC transporter ATP-binding protein [Candidatus Cloacimonadota bacterium]